ncbi:MAG: hypothetical protein GY898_06670 [Proteobacteria bacterium]|nr:hypothetical protein [Pseudomonadota bacterium]
MSDSSSTSALSDALDRLWEAALALPDDAAAFDSLDPDARRAAHDVGQRCQDRLLRCLSRLVEGMAKDGVELLDDGLPGPFTQG